MSLQALLRKHSPGRPGVVTVGTFDGVHTGHRALLEAVAGLARDSRPPAAAIAIAFREQPRAFLRPDEPVRYLCSLEERLRLIGEAGIETVVPVEFGRALQALGPREFMKLLSDELTMTDFVTGPGATVGRDRAGDAEALVQIGADLGFRVHSVAAAQHGGAAVGSTAIRRALAKGGVEEAAVMLGRSYRLTGTVERGDGRGKELGFPTANLVQDASELPPVLPGDGIYAAWARLSDGARHLAATSIGVRPTFGGGRRTVEAYVLDYDGDLYGQSISLEFVARLRAEEKFESVDHLVAQITRDVEMTRSRLAPGARAAT